MKQLLTTIAISLFLVSCASYDAVTFESTPDFLSKNQIKNERIKQGELTMPSTDMPEPTPERNANTQQQTKDILLLGTEVFNFVENEPGWYNVDDNVMGGVSSSTVMINDLGILSFSGKMSLENNGGFSSIRSEWSPINLYDADGLLIRVAGDGKTYRLRIQSAATGSEIAYNAIFETDPDSWNIVYIPFDSMVPTYRGFIMDVGKLDKSSIGSFGFMLSDKQPGEFELQVDWIRAIAEEELPITGEN
jgi:monofunctional biosynthetic peptidoglycan transglycosylase